MDSAPIAWSSISPDSRKRGKANRASPLNSRTHEGFTEALATWAFLKAIKDPALTAHSTARSEAALPKLFEETVRFGVPRRVASFVIPTGYSFIAKWEGVFGTERDPLPNGVE